jgi:(p)ppGpp synthase/HD superfamily hydrolase
MNENYEKQKIALRNWLMGKGYYKAVEAMAFAEKYHNGLRKDGNHEFSHQVSQACLARTLENLFIFKEEVFIVIFLHDICEDKGISFEQIGRMFGPIVEKAVRLMTKVYQGVKVPNDIYYKNMGECEIASVCKGFDRVHNLMSMLGGFNVDKRISYIGETLEFTVPMLKIARKNFSRQEGVYENIKFIMTNQVNLYNALNAECAANMSKV